MVSFERDRLKFAKDGEATILVMSLPIEDAIDGVVETFALPICEREGGALLALPKN